MITIDSANGRNGEILKLWIQGTATSALKNTSPFDHVSFQSIYLPKYGR
jgi:hypothetical protein